MQPSKISILSTRPVNESLIEAALQQNIETDVLSFIETAAIQSIEVQQEIEQVLLQSATVIFTSMNAVEAVADELHDQLPNWNIYSIGTTTSELVKQYFGEKSLAGTADSAAALATLIAAETSDTEVIFFCGDQRRDELPDILRKNDIDVHEIVVYETVAVPHKVEKPYHGILFFSPSAVESFFSVNKVKEQTILFAIGNTTAKAIRKFSNNKIILSNEPGKGHLFRKMMDYFGDV
jgi:uroporphyrinogen-III synthase